NPEPYTEEGLLGMGAFRVLRKPFAFAEFREALDELAARRPLWRVDRGIELPPGRAWRAAAGGGGARDRSILVPLHDEDQLAGAGPGAADQLRRPGVGVEVGQAERQRVAVQLVDAGARPVTLRAGGVDDVDLPGVLAGVDLELRGGPLVVAAP